MIEDPKELRFYFSVYFIEVYLIYSGVLIFAVQQSDSVIHIYTYVYIYTFLFISFSIMVYLGYWIQFLVLYNRTLFCIHSMYKSFLFVRSLSIMSDSLRPYGSPAGSAVHGTFQERILGSVPISSSRGSSQPRDWTCVSWVFCIAGGFFTHWATGEAHIIVCNLIILNSQSMPP